MKETEHNRNKEKVTLKELIDHSYQENFLPRRLLQLLDDKANYSISLIIVDCAIVNGKLHSQNRLHVPNYYILCHHLYCLHLNSSDTGHLSIVNIYK